MMSMRIATLVSEEDQSVPLRRAEHPERTVDARNLKLKDCVNIEAALQEILVNTHNLKDCQKQYVGPHEY